MLIKQISVFIEKDKPGQVFKPAKVLANAGIDLCAISISDNADNVGILHMITRDNEKAVKALKEAGFTTNVTELIGAVVENVPGGLSNLLSVFEKENINIEYFYSFMSKHNEEAIMFFRVEKNKEAVEKLEKNGVRLCKSIV
jgi:hypothetical protein